MKKLFLMMAIAASAGLFFAGCSKDNEEPTPGPGGDGGGDGGKDSVVLADYYANYNNDMKTAEIKVDLSAAAPLLEDGMPLKIDTSFTDIKGTFALKAGNKTGQVYMLPENADESSPRILGTYVAGTDSVKFKQAFSPAELFEYLSETGVDINEAMGAGAEYLELVTDKNIIISGVGLLSGKNKITYTLNIDGEIAIGGNIKIPIDGKIEGVGTKK